MQNRVNVHEKVKFKPLEQKRKAKSPPKDEKIEERRKTMQPKPQKFFNKSATRI